MTELRAVAHRRPDVENRALTDEDVLAERDGADLDDAGPGPVPVEEPIVSRSVQMGVCRVSKTVPRPTRAPSARR
jgi:hypothetical protein